MERRERAERSSSRTRRPTTRPNQAAIQNGTIKGFAAYKVADTVNTHEGWGLGSYCNYTSDPAIVQDHGFQAPVKSGVKFHDLLVVSRSAAWASTTT